MAHPKWFVSLIPLPGCRDGLLSHHQHTPLYINNTLMTCTPIAPCVGVDLFRPFIPQGCEWIILETVSCLEGWEGFRSVFIMSSTSGDCFQELFVSRGGRTVVGRAKGFSWLGFTCVSFEWNRRAKRARCHCWRLNESSERQSHGGKAQTHLLTLYSTVPFLFEKHLPKKTAVDLAPLSK